MREFWKRHRRAEAVLVLVLGLLLAGVGLSGYVIDRGLAERGVVTTATVLDVDRGRDMDTYTVRYTVAGGQVVTSETSFAVGEYGPGQQMQVEYDEDNPTTVGEVGARDGVWILYGGFGLIGLGMIARGGWVLRRHKRR